MTHRSTRRSFLHASSTALGALAVGVGLAPAAGALEGLATDRLVGGTEQLLKLARVWVTRDTAHLISGFDDTHNVFDDGSVEILLWPGDLARLTQTGLRFEITVHDLVARDRALAARPATRSVAMQPGETATGDYRFLEDYEADMRMLAETHPDHCELIELPFQSLEGRTIYGLEIAEDVTRKDGRPVFYNDGIHHAREWPAAEVPIMWAYDLLESYSRVEAGESEDLLDRRVHRIVQRTRNVIVPVVNVDGFRFSREFIEETGEQNPTGVGTLGGNGVEAAGNGLGAYWRKNMRNPVGVHGTLPANPVVTQSLLAYGVDPNRNYSYQWGGNGSSATQTDGTYRGTAPFSEPEANNVRHLHQAYQCVAGITHHTSGDLVLWAWGDTDDDAPDDGVLARLGFACGDYNGYRPTKSIDLYVTTGTCSDYTYGTFGSISYTFEHAGSSFHPPYETTVPEMYQRNRPALALLCEMACLEPGERDLMLAGLDGQDGVLQRLTGEFDEVLQGRLYEYAADTALDLQGRYHCIISGVVTDGGTPVPDATIRMQKDFENFLWLFGDGSNPTGESIEPELINAEITTDDQGRFRWVVNPTTRPFVEFSLTNDTPIEGARETVTLTAERDGRVSEAIEVFLSRGDVAELQIDLADGVAAVPMAGASGSTPAVLRRAS